MSEDDLRTLRRARAAARKTLRLLRAFVGDGDGLASPRLLATLARLGELRKVVRRLRRGAAQ